MSKIEKGKYRWGSKSALTAFEQQLMYNVSLDRFVASRVNKKGGVAERDKFRSRQVGMEDKKKYCLDFNKGICPQSGPHEGTLNGVTVLKHHVCKRCLIEQGVERNHPSKDCKK